MLDINFVRNNVELVQKNSRDKAIEVDVSLVISLDDQKRELQQKIDQIREKRNLTAKLMANEKDKIQKEELINQGKKLKEEATKIEKALLKCQNEFTELYKKIPNMALSEVPIGFSEAENVVVYNWGEIKDFDFKPLNHYQIAQARGWIDKERATKVTGARFAYLKGDLVKLQFAIINFVFDSLTDEDVIKKIIKDNQLKIKSKPFVPILPPYMIKTQIYDDMDRLQPSDDRYKIEGENLWLQGSAEHVLGSMYVNEMFEEADLPIRCLGYATSFRKEAGTYGKDMEGIFRMHQFDKIELESFATANDGYQEHKLMIAIQEYLLKALEMPYRVIQKCTFDIGKPNATGTDMEVWLPGQSKYRETHTADYMTDYQTRRLRTKVRLTNGKKEFVHTNDATAFAIGRIMIAIIENGQTATGEVNIPQVLQKYLNGRSKI